ncbi:SGNH/GDSL hydrolase family protein [Streptomyces acidiscabies]|uniref:SGNH/GDSL hydrolase family protein n=1 Tax=Streptomyces acidiscabies TaxID=42234 RepID=UPI00076E8C50|nr:SGNH/GDSL hydrolase family protein [Streptomyces acidiscabies]GAQ50484.1 GDSL-like Lipase/Acylhydrolase [Streptomyces acidiscabies]
MNLLRRFGPGLALSAMTVVLSTPALAFAQDTTSGKDATYYISLGDSIASGYQPDVDKDTRIAYTDQLYTQLKQRDPGLKHIRLGCSGETTKTLISGGTCRYPKAKSQLDAALKAMAQHRGRIALVTLTVGANDIKACVSPAGALDAQCLNRTRTTMGKNIAQITAALHKAGTKNTRFVGSTYYNPFLATWLLGPAGQKSAKDSAPLVKAANTGIAQVFKATGFQVADVAGAYFSDDFTTQVDTPAFGKVPRNVATICKLTWTCTPQTDPHPNAAGHKVIAAAFAGALAKPRPAAPATAGEAAVVVPASDKGAGHPSADGQLAETGASGSTPLVAGTGLAVVAAGGGAAYVARRRRAGAQG